MCNDRFLEEHVMLKFSTIPLVSGEKHLLIRWSAYTLGVQVKREGSLTGTPPPPPPPPPPPFVRLVTTRRGLRECAEPMAIFLLLGKNEFLRTRTVLTIRVATGLWAAE